MNKNWHDEDSYELFEGDIRRLDELVAQLELWRDEKTINHKKEEERLDEYVELATNLEELKGELEAAISENKEKEDKKELALSYERYVADKFEAYEATEADIFAWIREIKLLNALIMKSDLLRAHRARFDAITKQD